MSYPLNPLDDYRSYSYHTILLVSNTTEGLRPFLSTSKKNDDAALSAITSTPQGELVQIPGGSSDAYLVMDSRRTSGFSIRDFDYQSFPGTGNPSQTHIIKGALNMTIVDADGIVFINYLKYLIDDKLKSDLLGIHFVLKTMFVGHKIDGTTDFISTASIPLIILNIEFEVNYKEGVYTMAFLPLTQNAATEIASFSRIKDVLSITSDDGKLGTAVRSLENRMNETYRDWYKNLNVSLKAAGEASNTPIGKTGRLVQVMITIPKDWEEFDLDGGFNKVIERNFIEEYKKRREVQDQKVASDKEATTAAPQTVDTSTNGSGNLNRQFVSFAPTLSLLDVIAEVFKLCPRVSEMANRKAVLNNVITLFKTVTSVTSNSEVVVLHFDILEYKVPNITIKPETSESQYFSKMEDGRVIPKNSLEFDYIFTGKNSDITEFNLKMEFAQQLLLNTSKTGSSSHRLVADQKTQNENPVTLTKVNAAFIRENDPVFHAMDTIDSKKNFAGVPEKTDVDSQLRNQESRNEWLHAVSRCHFNSSIGTKVTIRGNPNLLNKFIIDVIPAHVIPENIKIQTAVESGTFVKSSILGNDSTWLASKAKYRKELDDYFEDNLKKELKGVVQGNTEISGPKAHTYPMFIKINVYAPNSLNYGGHSEKLNVNDSSQFTKFWFDGWYRVASISNKFSDGLFMQELELYAFELYGPEITTTTGGAEKPTASKTEATSNTSSTNAATTANTSDQKLTASDRIAQAVAKPQKTREEIDSYLQSKGLPKLSGTGEVVYIKDTIGYS